MRLTALAAVLAVLTLVSGCAPKPVEPLKPVTPVHEYVPPFSSTEEALSAAAAAYDEYLAIAYTIMGEGGEAPERILQVVTPEYAQTEFEGFESLRSEQLRTVGIPTYSNLMLQKQDDVGVVVYLCSDVSSVDVINSSGLSVVSQDRQAKTALEVAFDFDEANRLLVSSRDSWPRAGVCE